MALCKIERYNIHKDYKFLSYASSKLEIEWLNIIKENDKNYTENYCNLIKPYLKRLEVLHNDISNCKNYTYNKCNGADLSYFIYTYKNGKTFKEYIEPLFGILRNTFSICYNNSKGNILSKSYLLPSYINAINSEIVYLDAGASTFYTGAGGSSQKYFYEFYRKYPSLKYKKWFLWEIKRQDIKKIMKEIPISIKEVYNYYNKPINVDIKSNDNPLKILKKYQYNSYIIFKLDVDNPKVELPILDYLINSSEFKLDEFYFEYHYYSKIMMKWWGKNVDYNCSLYCAINKFLYLRKKGIRSHPWV